jgi:hypothetical protein
MTCPSFSDRDAALRQMMGPPTVTMHDEYGRCIHCGFWHKPGTMAEDACAEHEEQYRARGGCMCALKRLPTPIKMPDGSWRAPTAQECLRSDMRRDTDPRWHLLPVEDKPPRSYGWLIWPALVLGLAACVVIASI